MGMMKGMTNGMALLMCERWGCATASGARVGQFPACFLPFFTAPVPAVVLAWVDGSSYCPGKKRPCAGQGCDQLLMGPGSALGFSP